MEKCLILIRVNPNIIKTLKLINDGYDLNLMIYLTKCFKIAYYNHNSSDIDLEELLSDTISYLKISIELYNLSNIIYSGEKINLVNNTISDELYELLYKLTNDIIDSILSAIFKIRNDNNFDLSNVEYHSMQDDAIIYMLK